MKEEKFKKRSELTWEEKKGFPKVSTKIKLAYNKKKDYENLSVTFEIPTEIENKTIPIIADLKQFSKVKYHIFSDELKLNSDNEIHVLNLPVRLVKGQQAGNEKKYFQYELFMSPSVTISWFFSFEEIQLMKLRKPLVKFVLNPKFDLEEEMNVLDSRIISDEEL